MTYHAITDEMLRERIQHLDDDIFDSHALIEALMQYHPQQYTMDLYSFVKNDDPIHSLHQSIGQRLLGIDSIEKTDNKVESRNVRGNYNVNQEWRRK